MKQGGIDLRRPPESDSNRVGTVISADQPEVTTADAINSAMTELQGMYVASPVNKQQENWNSLVGHGIELLTNYAEYNAYKNEPGFSGNLTDEFLYSEDSYVRRMVELGQRAYSRADESGQGYTFGYVEPSVRELGDYYEYGILSALDSTYQVLDRARPIALGGMHDSVDSAVSKVLNFDSTTAAELGRTTLAANLIGVVPVLSMPVSAGQISQLEVDKRALNILYDIGAIGSDALTLRIQEAGLEQVQAAVSGPLGTVGKTGAIADLLFQGTESAYASKARLNAGGLEGASSLSEVFQHTKIKYRFGQLKALLPSEISGRNVWQNKGVNRTEQLRKAFDSTQRAEFLKQWASSDQAKRIFGQAELDKIAKRGQLPGDWVVHHKKPLYRGGDNSFDNLRVMRSTIHTRLNQQLHYYPEGQNPYGLN